MRFLAAAIVLGSTCWAVPSAFADQAADEAAIRETTQQYVAALGRGDLAAVAKYWRDDGDLIDESGRVTPARELFGTQAAAPAEGAAQQIKLEPTALRFLSADVAVEDGFSEVTPPGTSTPVRGRFTALWVKTDNRWQLASVREARLEKPRSAAQLAELDWLAGQWSGDHDQVRIEITARWNTNHTFLIRDLKVLKDGQSVFSANQRIGWDPASRRIKTWMFDSDGGHAEGTWSKEGDAWVVQAHGVLPDGRRTSSTNVYTLDSPDSITWKSTGATTNGVELPDFVIQLERKKATE